MTFQNTEAKNLVTKAKTLTQDKQDRELPIKWLENKRICKDNVIVSN